MSSAQRTETAGAGAQPRRDGQLCEPRTSNSIVLPRMEPEPEPELDEALLLSMVRRAVVLEETGRPEEALPLYEQAYAAFKAAGQ